EAVEEGVPAFERMNFISIFTSNLDEFFMIRVGSLLDQTFLPKPQIDNKTGMDASEQLEEIFRAVAPLYKKRDKIYRDVTERLADKGITWVSADEMRPVEEVYAEDYFESYVLPVLSPQIINAHHPFPHLVNKALYIILSLKIDDKTAFGIIPVPASVERVIWFPGGNFRYTLLENIVLKYADRIFDNCKVHSKSIISVTRNADINVSSLVDEDEDFRYHMKKVLKKRSRLAPVRLEYYMDLDEKLEKFLVSRLNLKKAQVFGTKTPLEMSYVSSLLDKLPEHLADTVTYEHFEPQPPKWLVPGESMISRVMKQDLFLSYPYDQMDPFLQLIKEAANDERVVSIRITIYRLASKATLVDHLRTAAENGKDVTVIMELRARFDEANNINWSESLEDAGCTVIYGLKDYKVHSKVCLITLMEKGKVKRITQVGTGNYNEKTAKLYTDMSLMTSDPDIGNDASAYFKNMSIANLNGQYSKLMVAPHSMKNRILALIENESEKARRGEPARITVKINSLTDRQTIDALKDASQAGVKIEMIIRGICCILPDIEGYTDNIHVTSVVGRFLEHSRVYCFGEGEDLQMYISSADFMTRNLNRRVEVACPITDPAIRTQIMDILQLMLRDNVKARNLRYDGLYEKKRVGDEAVDCQQELIRRAILPARPSQTEAGEEQPQSLLDKIKALFSRQQ
ncbi:MAG TPA: polyphosphate kinase 1, partial [Candidatus Copromorpha excrementigallinarum]|nr:polyphosphate kinase 1 [Candidatus Copromorpha excrementigallinarum]